MRLDEQHALLYRQRNQLHDDIRFGRIPAALEKRAYDRRADMDTHIHSIKELIMQLLAEHHENQLDAIAKAKEQGTPIVKAEPESQFDLRVLQAAARGKHLQALRRSRRIRRKEIQRRLTFE